jgi:hypothetical protein
MRVPSWLRPAKIYGCDDPVVPATRRWPQPATGIGDGADGRWPIHAIGDGVEVEADGSTVVIQWDQAVAVARRIIELARARGDVS